MSTALTPCLGFQGNTREAFAFYANAPGAKIDALSQGGQVTMPTAPAFWARTFGMLTAASPS